MLKLLGDSSLIPAAEKASILQDIEHEMVNIQINSDDSGCVLIEL